LIDGKNEFLFEAIEIMLQDTEKADDEWTLDDRHEDHIYKAGVHSASRITWFYDQLRLIADELASNQNALHCK